MGLVTLFMLTILLPGCSSSSGPEFTVPVRLSAIVGPQGQVSNVTSATLTVFENENILATQDMTVLAGRVVAEVDVPPGQDLTFTVNAYSDQDVLLYSGSADTDVGLGEDITLEINLIPQVLMLKVDPLYSLITAQGPDNEFYFDIYVYNVQELFGASFRIEYSNSFVVLTNVEIGDFLGQEPITLIRNENDYTAVSITRTRGQNGISGSGHLARIYYYGQSTGTSQLEFNPNTVSLLNPDGNPVNNFSSLVLENGAVEVAVETP